MTAVAFHMLKRIELEIIRLLLARRLSQEASKPPEIRERL
jgi:hypothetical protein